MLRRRAGGESAEHIQPELFSYPPASARATTLSAASFYRALAKHEAYPKAAAQAHADIDALRADDIPGPRPAPSDRASL